MYIKRSINFGFDTKKKNGVLKKENVPIRMRVTFGGKRIDFSMGHSIDMDKWDSDKQRVRNGCSNKLKISASQINADINAAENEMQKIFQEFEMQEIIPSLEQIKAIFNSRILATQSGEQLKVEKEEKKLSFFDVYDRFYNETARLNNWTKASHQKYSAVRNHLKDFKKRLTFEYFDEKGLNDYVDFLRSHLDMRNSTVEKQIDHLKTFLRWAARKGFHDNREFEVFRPKLKNIPKKVIFLTKAELEMIEQCVIPPTKQYLQRVRDVFLFCCYSGLRYSDVYNLRKCDIKNDKIIFTTIKTADSLEVNLNKYTRAILARYEEIPLEDDKALPVISNQRMNDYVKELGELAGINEQIRISYYKGNERIDEYEPKYALLGTHTGRRTFICNALALGIPANVVMKWTGHSDYKAMKPYIDIADQIKADMMTRFDNF